MPREFSKIRIRCMGQILRGLREMIYPPTVVRQSIFSSKTLFNIFYKSTGPVFIHCVEPRKL